MPSPSIGAGPALFAGGRTSRRRWLINITFLLSDEFYCPSPPAFVLLTRISLLRLAREIGFNGRVKP